jgi:uncharacterized phage protein (TIGR02220 family)
MGSRYLKVRNIDKFQHYKQRNPPWIKLHQTILDNYEFCEVADATKWHMIGMLLLASRIDNKIPDDPRWIALRISAKTKIDLQAMLDIDFIRYIDGDDGPVDNDPLPATETVTLVKEDSVRTIVEHLNKRAGTNYRAGSKATAKLIGARISEGYDVDDFISVIDDRCKRWLHDPKMKEYIRPSTLFNNEKFESYLGQVNYKPVASGDGPSISDQELERQMIEEINRDLLTKQEESK